MSEVKARAEKSREKRAALGPDLDLAGFTRRGGDWSYDRDYSQFSPEERGHLLKAGIELTDLDHGSPMRRGDYSGAVDRFAGGSS